MKFKLNGNIEIDMDLTLLNPTMELYKVDYNLSTNEFDVVVNYYENDGIYAHTKFYHFINTTQGQLTMDMVFTHIISNSVIADFITNGTKL